MKRHHVVIVPGIQGQDIDDDLHLVAQPLHEGGAQRAVDEACRQDRGLAGTSLTAEERAGDAPRGVHSLLDVDGEREEVDGVARCLRGSRRGKQHRVAVKVDRSRSVGLLGEDAGFETDDVPTVLAVVDDRFGVLRVFFEINLLHIKARDLFLSNTFLFYYSWKIGMLSALTMSIYFYIIYRGNSKIIESQEEVVEDML